jgi:isoaspartyl peptidase/L-asparaginase-like protein (Ntn-hydrolase superfamily)
VLPPLSGGAVAVDEYGRLAASYNTFGMFTGLADSTGYETCWDKADR